MKMIHMSWIINILLIFFDTDFIQNLNLKLSRSLSLLPIDFYWHPILNQKVQDFLIKLQRIGKVFRCKVPILFRRYSDSAIQFRADVFLQPRRRHQHDHNKIGISKFWWNMETHRWWQVVKWKNVLREVKNVSISIQLQTSVTIPSLFLSNAFRNKSDDRKILMKFSFVKVPSSPAIFITLKTTR